MMLESVLLGTPVVCSTFDNHIKSHPILNNVAKMYHFKKFFEVTGITRTVYEENSMTANSGWH